MKKINSNKLNIQLINLKALQISLLMLAKFHYLELEDKYEIYKFRKLYQE